MLPCPGLGDETSLAHPLGEERLTEHVVDLMRTRVVEVLALEVDLSASQVLGHVVREIEQRRPARVVVEQTRKLCGKGRVSVVAAIRLLKLDDRTH